VQQQSKHWRVPAEEAGGKMKFIFTADLHGNAAQLAAVVQYAEAHSFDAILLGGGTRAPSSQGRVCLALSNTT